MCGVWMQREPRRHPRGLEVSFGDPQNAKETRLICPTPANLVHIDPYFRLLKNLHTEIYSFTVTKRSNTKILDSGANLALIQMFYSG
jgi:hypothetical protein